jgi:hypothetical protein
VRVLEHLPLGGDLDPAAEPSCADVDRLAALPGVTRLAAVERADPIVVDLPGDTLEALVDVPESGLYELWIGGSFVGDLEAQVDGRTVGSARHQLQWPGQYVPLGSAHLPAGERRVGLRYDLGGWRPGSVGRAPFPLDLLVLARPGGREVISVPPAQAQTLCGRRLDWVEALG